MRYCKETICTTVLCKLWGYGGGRYARQLSSSLDAGLENPTNATSPGAGLSIAEGGWSL